MRYAYALAGLAAFAAAHDASAENETAADSLVVDLKKDTFDAFIKDNDFVLAEFFAPWCGHCKALAPEYEKAALQLKDNKKIALAKIDCTEEADLCSAHGVEGYPTLKVFNGIDNVKPYEGQRKADSIIGYMTKQTLPPISILEDDDALTEFKKSDKVVVVGYYPSEDTKSSSVLTEVAKKLRDTFSFASIADEALAKAAGVKAPALVVYRTFDEPQTIFDKKFTAEDIEAFVRTSSVPLVGEIGPETYKGYMDAQIPLAYIFAETAEDREELATLLKPIAQKHKGKVNFGTIDAAAFGAHAGNLNLKLDTWPAFAIQDTIKNQKFPFDKQGAKTDITEKTIGKFVDDFVAGKIEPSIKSEPIPEKQDGPVTVVVAKNWDQVVLDDTKDVLVEFYAPWCGHCKALAPKYDILGEWYKAHSDKVTIAKVDATLNDVPEEIQGFPTIKLYAKGKKDSPIDFAGAREVVDFVNFIGENGTHKIKAVEPEDTATEAVETDGMPQQAAAATEKIKSAASKVAEAVEAVVGDDDSADEHDEL